MCDKEIINPFQYQDNIKQTSDEDKDKISIEEIISWSNTKFSKPIS